MPMVWRLEGKVTEVSCTHSAKANFPIVVTPSGSTSERRLEMPKKAASAMVVTALRSLPSALVGTSEGMVTSCGAVGPS